MNKININITLLVFSLIIVLSQSGCIKETYNMNMLSKRNQLSPTLAISAINGKVLFSDVVKKSDTVVFDQNKFVTLVFKKDKIIDLNLSDFSKGTIKMTATIEPVNFDLNINDFLSHIGGSFIFSNPSVTFTYTNSFSDSIQIVLNARGLGKDKSADLELEPFYLLRPNIPAQQEITSTYVIDKTNSNIPQIISLPPETINFSGSAILNISGKSDQLDNNILASDHLVGSLEIDLPLQLTTDNLQISDTSDNFFRDWGPIGSGIFQLNVKPEDFELFQIEFTARNGFPLDVTLQMNLYDELTKSITGTIDAAGILKAAPADSNGKATGETESTLKIDFTKQFLSRSVSADKIIFLFTLNTPGTSDIRIYSDYSIEYFAKLVVKPVMKLAYNCNSSNFL
jgi:hypothetical protein